MIISALMAIPMAVLSMVNFGLLSIWLNATVAAFILLHHLPVFLMAWIFHRIGQGKGLKGLTGPLAHGSSSYGTLSGDDPFKPLEEGPDRSIAYTMINVASHGFLLLINAIAFSIMIDINARGPLSSTLLAERLVSHKWNRPIQYGQTGVLGAELLVQGSLLTLAAMGWRSVSEWDEERQEEIDYGMAEAYP
jgi:hypothetical protein